jgi:hypothetical protein
MGRPREGEAAVSKALKVLDTLSVGAATFHQVQRIKQEMTAA